LFKNGSISILKLFILIFHYYSSLKLISNFSLLFKSKNTVLSVFFQGFSHASLAFSPNQARSGFQSRDNAVSFSKCSLHLFQLLDIIGTQSRVFLGLPRPHIASTCGFASAISNLELLSFSAISRREMPSDNLMKSSMYGLDLSEPAFRSINRH